MLIGKNFSSQPQYENCTHMIKVPFMEYQTLSVVSIASFYIFIVPLMTSFLLFHLLPLLTMFKVYFDLVKMHYLYCIFFLRTQKICA